MGLFGRCVYDIDWYVGYVGDYDGVVGGFFFYFWWVGIGMSFWVVIVFC